MYKSSSKVVIIKETARKHGAHMKYFGGDFKVTVNYLKSELFTSFCFPKEIEKILLPYLF